MRGRGRYSREPAVRKNERIRAREVRLLSPDGKMLGIVSRDEALRLAKQAGLDLVEISATARPPVCRILDFGKYMYEQSKKQKETKAKAAKTSKLKEVKFRPRTEEHDYMTKLKRGEAFLFKGNKLKLSLMFRGRENEHKDVGREVLRRVARDLEHVAQPDTEMRAAGRHLNWVLSPLPINKRRLKFNADQAAVDAHDGDEGDEGIDEDEN